jgi:ribosomal-protein-alanine N-acetyltransferase
MTRDTKPILTERLLLMPMTPAFLAASLAGDTVTAERLAGLTIPADWFQEQALIQIRLKQLQKNPNLQPWLLRAITLRQGNVMVGHIGFHSQPDPDYLQKIAPGAVEFGYTVYPSYRRQRYAKEACESLMHWAQKEHQVARFVLTISPDNSPSIRLAHYLGFQRIGSHADETDGVEDIYELHRPDVVTATL